MTLMTILEILLDILLDIRGSKVNRFILNIPHGRQRQELLELINLMKNLGNTYPRIRATNRQITIFQYTV